MNMFLHLVQNPLVEFGRQSDFIDVFLKNCLFSIFIVDINNSMFLYNDIKIFNI